MAPTKGYRRAADELTFSISNERGGTQGEVLCSLLI